MDFPQDHPLVHTAWEICRWHHERWDGKGYPDGLKGEEIPISAQVVSNTSQLMSREHFPSISDAILIHLTPFR